MGSMSYQKDETENSSPAELIQRSARRRRMELMQFDIVQTGKAVPSSEKRQKQKVQEDRHYQDLENKCAQGKGKGVGVVVSEETASKCFGEIEDRLSPRAWALVPVKEKVVEKSYPRFGATYVCGRRRDMEDAVALHPWLTSGAHFYGVYDGHGCSHVATKCRDRMHKIVKEEIELRKEEISSSWEETMKRSFSRMDEETVKWCDDKESSTDCRCELQIPQCYCVGSTAVVAIVTPNNIIVSNCGDSRAIICRNGVATPLSSDQKPDRADELKRIEEAGGHVIFWEGARVLGVLAMSRAIGDSYLKPFVISEPEVTIIDRTEEDECLVLASDGLWDVVSNDMACQVASGCLWEKKQPLLPLLSPEINVTKAGESSDKTCADASMLLTKLALGRHSGDNVSAVVIDLRREEHN